jgi:cysteinyl-tRNA synthetase
MAIRLFILQAQYRQPIDFTEEAIKAATKGWETIRDATLFAHEFGAKLGWTDTALPTRETVQSAIAGFEEAMDDDFNTSVALSYVFELAKKICSERNSLLHSGSTDKDTDVLYQKWQALSYMTNVLGFVVNFAAAEADRADDANISDSEIEVLIQQRREAKQSKNYAESDRLRNLLKAQGITLIDQKDGTTRWIRE